MSDRYNIEEDDLDTYEPETAPEAYDWEQDRDEYVRSTQRRW